MTCMRRRRRSSAGRLKRSTHTLVVRAVNALSALEKAAEVMPNAKNSKAELRARAEKQIDRAAELVVERIVNV